MKTMKNVMYVSLVAAGLLTGLAACEDKVEFNSKDTASAENEATMDGYFEDTDDMALTAVMADDGTADGGRESSGRVIGRDKLDHRFKCADVTIDFAADNSFLVPHGTITIDFGTGCTDSNDNVRRGKLIVEFKGRRFMPNASIVTTTDGYVINEVAIEGTRTVTNISGSTEEAPKFNVKLENGKATWSTGEVATREVNRVHEWIRAANPMDDQWSVTGSASGTNRNGDVYEMNITTALVYKRECAVKARVFMAVAGTKELIVNGRRITIDYGTGDCDRTVTISAEGKSKQLEVTADI